MQQQQSGLVHDDGTQSGNAQQDVQSDKSSARDPDRSVAATTLRRAVVVGTTGTGFMTACTLEQSRLV